MAASGIGRAMALMAAREGACMVLSDIAAEGGLETTALAQSLFSFPVTFADRTP